MHGRLNSRPAPEMCVYSIGGSGMSHRSLGKSSTRSEGCRCTRDMSSLFVPTTLGTKHSLPDERIEAMIPLVSISSFGIDKNTATLRLAWNTADRPRRSHASLDWDAR